MRCNTKNSIELGLGNIHPEAGRSKLIVDGGEGWLGSSSDCRFQEFGTHIASIVVVVEAFVDVDLNTCEGCRYLR